MATSTDTMAPTQMLLPLPKAVLQRARSIASLDHASAAAAVCCEHRACTAVGSQRCDPCLCSQAWTHRFTPGLLRGNGPHSWRIRRSAPGAPVSRPARSRAHSTSLVSGPAPSAEPAPRHRPRACRLRTCRGACRHDERRCHEIIRKYCNCWTVEGAITGRQIGRFQVHKGRWVGPGGVDWFKSRQDCLHDPSRKDPRKRRTRPRVQGSAALARSCRWLGGRDRLLPYLSGGPHPPLAPHGLAHL